MFTLPFQIPESEEKIRIKDSIFSIGSCFSDHIGEKLKKHKFNAISNPLGIIYNPYSISKNLKLLLSEGLDPENYIKNRGIYYHWDTHSCIAGTDLTSFKELLQERSFQSKQSLVNANWLIITLGTIYAYKYIPNGKIVANCHKVPQKQFERLSLSKTEIIEDSLESMEVIRTINPTAKFIFTVSPVRHVRDGLVANNLSKSVLLQAVHEIVSSEPNTFYFPSYEIMIDELRDYRFYKDDMIHPSEQAIDYIWNRFIETYMDDGAKQFINEWQSIIKSIQHRPFHPNSAEHQQFLHSTIKKLQKMEDRVDISSELEFLQKQLSE